MIFISGALLLSLLLTGASYSRIKLNYVVQSNYREVTTFYLNQRETLFKLNFVPTNLSIYVYVLDERQTAQLVSTGSLQEFLVEKKVNGSIRIPFSVPKSGYYSIVVFNPTQIRVNVQTEITMYGLERLVLTVSGGLLTIGTVMIATQKSLDIYERRKRKHSFTNQKGSL